jgi:hypothetical protein
MLLFFSWNIVYWVQEPAPRSEEHYLKNTADLRASRVVKAPITGQRFDHKYICSFIHLTSRLSSEEPLPASTMRIWLPH